MGAPQPSPNFAQYRTVGEAAEFLGVSAATLRNWDRSGKLKPRRHPQNGYRIYLHEDLESVLRSADRSVQEDTFAPHVSWGEVQESEHFVQFYESDEFLIDSVSAFIGAALQAGECGVIIATPEHRNGIQRSLADSGVDLSAVIESGQYVVLDAADTLARLMVNGLPDDSRFHEVIGGVVAGLTREGGQIHAFGEMVALLWRDGQREAALRLEELWSELGQRYRFALCCAYPIGLFGDEAGAAGIEGICRCHTRVIPSESYSTLDDPVERLQAITLLQQKAASLQAEITHRGEAELALSRREQELADFFDNASEGLHKIGPDGNILWANRAELTLLGYAPEEYIGRHISEFHVDREVIDDILKRLSQGECLHNQPARLRCRDGTVRDVLINSNAYFENGKFLFTRCFTRDVTEMKVAERDRAMLAAIVESSQDAIISKSLDGIIRSWNAAAERLFGYLEHEVIGKPITLIIPPDRVQEEDIILSRLRRGERVECFETVRVTKDGRQLDVSLTVSPMRDSAGNLVGASKIARDITRQKRAEEALREGEDRYRRLTELLPVAVYTCDARTGTITYFNQVAATLWGRVPQLGDTDQRFCGSLKMVLPDGTHLLHEQCPMAVALREGCEYRNQEVDIIRPDGSRITVLVNIDPIRNSSGDVIGAINVFHDVTAWKQAEQQLREQKENLQTLLDTLPVAVFIADDPECRTISGNLAAARLLRMPLDANFSITAPLEERPSHFRVLKDGEAVAFEELPIQRAARGETVRMEEFDHEFTDGAIAHTVVSAQPLLDSSGRSRGAVACMLDISDLKQAEVNLREADRRKDEFLATLAHELRNPLAPIRNGIELMRMGIPDEQMAQEVRRIMERQMEHMTRLVDDLLDVSRITRDKIELRRQRVSLADVVQNAAESVRPLIDAAGQALQVSLPQDPVILNADPTRMAQIFSNLLSNSAKYTDAGGRISLTAERQNGAVLVRVEDNGIGIPCESLAYVFDMFRQVDRSSERAQSGLGIGLTLVRRLVELHGGTINAQSEGPGKGSAFTVRLPVAAAVERQAAAGLNGTSHAATSKRKILVVDDNKDSVSTLCNLLRLRGNEVRGARDGFEAIDVAADFLPDVILMDVGMPRLNGHEATRRIRQTSWGRDMTIITLSGWGQEEDLRQSAAAGSSGHLTKPVDVGDLEKLIASQSVKGSEAVEGGVRSKFD